MQRTTTKLMKASAQRSGGGAVRRLVGLEREYRCSVGHEHHSWARLHACPECGEPLMVAVIHRAALATG